MSNNQQKASWWIIIAFMIVPLVTSLVSTIHVVSFFELSNYYTLSIILALAFELGALSSLAGLVAMDKINKSTVWIIFILLTVFQMMGNTYYSYDTTTSKMAADSGLIKNFTELFGFDIFDNTDVIFVKRIIAIFSGAILPVISLCFLHLLVSYLVKSNKPAVAIEPNILPENKEENSQTEAVESEFQENTPEEDFKDFLEKKKKKLEEDRTNYSELLRLWYKDGQVKQGEELPSYKNFIEMVDAKKYNTDTIKIFLTLCNYLDISKVNGEQKMALKSYEEAKTTLEGYLTLNIQ
jgi:hypothetical protein